MKKNSMIGLTIALALTLTACGGGQTVSSKATASRTSTVGEVLDAAAAGTDQADAAAETGLAAQGDLISAEADVDLTRLSSTMVYSEVSQMVTSPEDYVGKTVKMTGAFTVYEENGNHYYACIISDATACCANGIEFVWAGDHQYPQDYPKEGTEITVTGTFQLYEEGGYLYTQLADAEVSF